MRGVRIAVFDLNIRNMRHEFLEVLWCILLVLEQLLTNVQIWAMGLIDHEVHDCIWKCGQSLHVDIGETRVVEKQIFHDVRRVKRVDGNVSAHAHLGWMCSGVSCQTIQSLARPKSVHIGLRTERKAANKHGVRNIQNARSSTTPTLTYVLRN